MRNRDENKAVAIREKAMEMIVQEGFDGLSMHKLAKAVNISASTIYIYFKNREDLLNQLYINVAAVFTTVTLQDFDPEMDFEAGLWLQWKNRYQHILKYPLHFRFSEQFRNSPLIQQQEELEDPFRKTMRKFIQHAEEKQQLVSLPPEVFWSVAYGPFYTLVKFHLDNQTMSGKPFSLSEENMRQTFDLVVKALRP
ncbi:TetR/AcrR family transcriptional regulator [Chitinophaga nivalis]|uniref:TetR/AcrR family transcriptional regulator n=1 Tax=Chitinophaga nivalis TaxID=2991709 RepID=A0ABT3IHH0_9BACT|nr:TetR/AcrR family transcriptional regulator [Chitinophaga nivalis]MCW3466943.1 TetR/AcrR family transcriptional regulator [Chitinophaga nivalis]MCW3483366.1 TetR/AcrR family transcriptional regulator [Chitinophaga nivalis]